MTDPLLQVAVQLSRAILPVIIVTGTLGNLLNIIVLTQVALKEYACSFYFLALSSNNLFYSSIIIPYRLISIAYYLNPALSSPALCKLIQYINDVCPSISPYFIVLASVDRFCASSTNARVRELSSTSTAKKATAAVVAGFMLFFLSTAVTADLRATDRLGCRIRTDTIYSQVYVIVQVVLLTVIAPCLMLIFGLMTVHNTKRSRAIPVLGARHRRTERQLTHMLFFQVGTHIVLTSPLTVTYMMILLPTAYQATQQFYAVYSICYIPFYAAYGTAFIVYVLSGRIYRKELIRLLSNVMRRWRGNRIEPVNTGALTQRSMGSSRQQQPNPHSFPIANRLN